MSQESRMPNLPEGAKTMPDLGFALFNLSPNVKYALVTNLFTKTRVPKAIRSLYTRLSVVGDKIDSELIVDYLVKDLMLRVSEQGHERVKEFETLFALELHRATQQKQEEKPRI